MIIGIDASNIRSGGGVTHLVELLKAADPAKHGFSKIIVWSGKKTLGQIEARPWLDKINLPVLDRSLLFRMFWQHFRLSKFARRAKCDVLFVPGGSYMGGFKPLVTLSQNLLPFELQELQRFGWSFTGLRLRLLRFTQSNTFRKADGMIFLTRYASDIVMGVIKSTAGRTTIIPHGIATGFSCPPQEQFPINKHSSDNPFKILYVSIINVYKHQWHTVDAVAMLRKNGLPIILELVGPAYQPALKRLKKIISEVDLKGEFIRYFWSIPYDKLPLRYAEADLCLFASSCENLPIILLEGMAAGLPVACSNRGPMPEVLGDAGVYFNPEDPNDIARALKELIESPELRAKKAKASFEKAQSYSWKRCADETFSFLAQVANEHKGKR